MTLKYVTPGYELRHLAGQAPDPLDPDLHHVAGFQEFVAAGADTGRRAGQDQVARMEGEPRRQMGNLLGQVEDHLARVGILLEDIVDPQLEAEILRVRD